MVRRAERWEPIPGYENYMVSDRGVVKNRKTGRICRPYDKGRNGARVSVLTADGYKNSLAVHRLVAAAFLTDYYAERNVYHKDKDKSNNDITNLYQKITNKWLYEQELKLPRYPTFRFSRIPGHVCLKGELNQCWQEELWT